MKKILFIILTISLALVSSCGKEQEQGQEYQITDNYYVKYEATVDNLHYDTVPISIKNRDGKFMTTSASRNNPLSITIGPVSKGFVAEMHRGSESMNIICTISVCKNSEPFAFQAGGVNDISYTIDY